MPRLVLVDVLDLLVGFPPGRRASRLGVSSLVWRWIPLVLGPRAILRAEVEQSG